MLSFSLLLLICQNKLIFKWFAIHIMSFVMQCKVRFDKLKKWFYILLSFSKVCWQRLPQCQRHQSLTYTVNTHCGRLICLYKHCTVQHQFFCGHFRQIYTFRLLKNVIFVLNCKKQPQPHIDTQIFCWPYTFFVWFHFSNSRFLLLFSVMEFRKKALSADTALAVHCTSVLFSQQQQQKQKSLAKIREKQQQAQLCLCFPNKPKKQIQLVSECNCNAISAWEEGEKSRK